MKHCENVWLHPTDIQCRSSDTHLDTHTVLRDFKPLCAISSNYIWSCALDLRPETTSWVTTTARVEYTPARCTSSTSTHFLLDVTLKSSDFFTIICRHLPGCSLDAISVTHFRNPCRMLSPYSPYGVTTLIFHGIGLRRPPSRWCTSISVCHYDKQ